MVKIEYNKTFLIQIGKDLKVRQNALPVLKNKEAALRAETRRIRLKIKKLEQEFKATSEGFSSLERMWSEFPDIVRIDKIVFVQKKIASIKADVIDKIIFKTESFSLFFHPAWFLKGIEIIKQMITLKAEIIVEKKILESIEYARRKTTQKVNLYEKVQIPFFDEAIRKIKRFLEDEDNLSKSSQKVIKKRLELVVGV